MSLLERVAAEGLLRSGRPVLVLLSGGRDSTCLLDLAVHIVGREGVRALHVNYGLREAADADEQHCVELCREFGVPLHVHRPKRPETGNLQAWARAERYAEARRMADAGDVAAGHTATDQVETILYRLASSPSRRALLGMAAREGALVRPLLKYTREETAAYCRERGLNWREDETNEADVYARGRIRRSLVPALRTVHPAAEQNVLALNEVLRAEAAVLEALVDEVLAGRSEVTLERLRALPAALQALVVQRLADEAAGALAPGAAHRAPEVAALSERGTAELDVGGGVRAVAEYGMVRFQRRLETAAPQPVELLVPGCVTFGDREVRCEPAAPAPAPGVLDRAALGETLLVRSWRPGDRMRPLGLGGASKSLQDLFTARRVPRRARAGVPVVETGGEIAWVAGVAMSERFKVTDSTREAVRLIATCTPQGEAAPRP